MPRPLSSASQTTLNNKAATIEAAYPYTPNVGTIPSPMDWAREGQVVAKTISYVGISLNSTPSTSYINTAQATTEQRMALGGHRLADLLNTLFAIRLGTVFRANGNFGFSWNAVSGKTYRVQWKQQLGDSMWNDLTNITASGNSASFSEPSGQTQRFYQVTYPN